MLSSIVPSISQHMAVISVLSKMDGENDRVAVLIVVVVVDNDGVDAVLVLRLVINAIIQISFSIVTFILIVDLQSKISHSFR